jgi:signal transduction histidine kinase
MIVLLVTLIIGWILLAVAASSYANYWWGALAVGTILLLLVLVGVVMYLVISVKEINLNQRQANFIDSVTHELKSPIASLKLYLQTLSRRNVNETQQADFVRFMLDDVERLDTLINHLLDAARVDQETAASEIRDVPLAPLLEQCAATACQRYRLPESTVVLKLAPAVVRGLPIDVEMIFRNLIDNALKYSGEKAEVSVETWVNGRGMTVTRVADNGPGIPAKLRRKIFGRFVRLGQELERSQPGTGLGLFIVRTLVKRMRGNITVRSRGAQPGTVFEVELPGELADPGVPAIRAVDNSGEGQPAAGPLDGTQQRAGQAS